MTETDWLTGRDFTEHVRFIADDLSARRRLLLAVGFCRAVGHLIDRPELAAALAEIDRSADGRATGAERERARQRCRELAQKSYAEYAAAVETGRGDVVGASVRTELAWAISYAANGTLPLAHVGNTAASAGVMVRTGTGFPGGRPPADPEALAEAHAAHDRLMRGVVWEVVGNPFRAVRFAPEWRTDTAVALARQMYESGEFSALPILADALQDAGCDAADVLDHCRDPRARHVRGCWVVDGVLDLS
jgi:hypothetical protein